MAITCKFKGLLICGLKQAPRVLFRGVGLGVSRREAAESGLLHSIGKSGRVKLVLVHGDSGLSFLSLERRPFSSVVQTERLSRVRRHNLDYK